MTEGINLKEIEKKAERPKGRAMAENVDILVVGMAIFVAIGIALSEFVGFNDDNAVTIWGWFVVFCIAPCIALLGRYQKQ